MSSLALNRRTSTAGYGVTLMRVMLGVVMLMHGWQKFHIDGVSATQAGFAGMGVPAADTAALAMIALELVGGALLIVGLGTRVVAALTGLSMLGAIWFAHLGAGFFAADGGFEYPLTLAVLGFAVALTGPGAAGLDRVVRRRR